MTDKSRRLKQFIDNFIEHIERLEKFIESDLTNVKFKSIELRLNDLNAQWNHYMKCLPPYDKLDEEVLTPELRESIEESYYNLRPELEDKIEALKALKAPKKEEQNNAAPLQINPKLPDIAMEDFHGDYLQWKSYIGTFNSLIHNNASLSTLTKFQYLKRSLKGAASLAIDSLDFTEPNYQIAHNLLKERFDRPSIICEQHIRNLFSYKSIDKPCPKRLLEMVDHFKSHLRSLESIGRPVNHWDDLIIYIMVSKLDLETKSRWYDEAPGGRLSNLDDLYNFLNIRSRKLESQPKLSAPPSSSSSNKSNSKGPSRQSKTSTSLNITKPNYHCNYCKRSGHTIVRCQKFLTLLTIDRQKFVTESKLCQNCLHSDHESSVCSNADRCRYCHQPHHSLLHQSNLEASQTTKQTAHDKKYASSTSTTHVSISSLASAEPKPSTSFVYLATALVQVFDQHDRPVIGRALLDSGSQINLISESFAAKLMLPKFKSKTKIQGIGSSCISIYSATKFTLKSTINNFQTSLAAKVIPTITSYQPPRFVQNVHNWKIPANIKLADPDFYKTRDIDILIGAEIYHELLAVGQIKLNDNLPILQNSVLGWIVCGRLKSSFQDSNECCHFLSEPNDLKDEIERFWTIENIDDFDKISSNEKNECEIHFKKHTSRDSNGRFIVKLPFSADPNTSLGDSYTMALRRFCNLERRLQKLPEVMRSYSEFMNEYVTLGHMSYIPSSSIRSVPNYFLPHHCVLKPDSSSTKLRVVFDASAKTSNGNSLNSILKVGPTVQSELFAILLRFRTHKFAFSADITKMYRQVAVHEDHRPFQLILWRQHPLDELKIYCLNTVTYGTASASYLATRCLVQLAHDHHDTFPTASAIIERDFYVDDLLTGSNSIDHAIQLKSEIETILQSGGMELKKWCSNVPDIIRDVPLDQHEPFLLINDNEVIKTLGILWQPASDRFTFSVNFNLSSTISKRTIFSQIARIYDPLGLISPVVMVGKLLMQTLWQYKLDWDQSIPLQLHTQWLEFRDELLYLNEFFVDRHIFNLTVNSMIELHGYSDASERAYGAALYIRDVSPDGHVSVNLLCSKSRVAPLKKVTIPRLELCAALLLAELYQKCILTLKLSFSNVYLWSDSTITLHWIKGDLSKWKAFVSNRVNQIHQLSRPENWFHVSSANNPADLISRGVTPSKLINSHLWLHGPDYLSTAKEQWPVQLFNEPIEEIQFDEMKKSNVLSISLLSTDNDDIIASIKFSNNYMSVIRVICYIMRFKNQRCGPLTPEDIDYAVIVAARTVQRMSFPEVYAGLSKPNFIVKDSTLKSLSLFRDENDVIRVGGRLFHTSLAYETKHPILLPSKHPFTLIIIRFIHRKNHHAGPLALLAAVRGEFWPVNGRSLCTKVYRDCIVCFKARPKSIHQRLGDLPSERVTVAPPFYSVGVDFCGPFHIHYRIRGKPPTKTYACIFVCFVTKAIHIEVASDLSTASFMGAFRRMIATRGLPAKVTSDNGTNFVGANTELHELYNLLQSNELNTAIQDYCVVNRVEWKFIPPYSPNFGGLHEASVKLFKYHMRRSMGTAKLTYEQLQTLVKEIEAILNSRPLTPISSSPDDLQCLTPGEILIGRPLTALPAPSITDRPPLDAWKHLEFIRCTFWKRWSKDYLRSQQQRYQWPQKMSSIKIGDMVMLVDDNLPPLYWRLGRITNFFPGEDGFIRVVQVKTAKGNTTRGITKICPLPLDIVETS